MEAIFDFLWEWQILVGAFLGGCFALMTAFVVAGTALRREERVAARLLMVDLLSIVAAAKNLKALAAEDKVSETDYPGWVCEKLSWRRPHLSPLFDAHVARANDIDANLAAHLSFVRMVYQGLQEHLARVENDKQVLHQTPLRGIPRSPGATAADARGVAQALALSGDHAECASHLLNVLVLTNVPRWAKRVRMVFVPGLVEKRSRQLLETGD